MTEQRFQFEPAEHGAGGFARVFKGYDRFLERDIAVKVLDPLVKQFEEEDRERFRREARILAKLSHPNIPSIFDVTFTEDQFLLIFEFIEGQNLADLLADQGPCSLSQARTWFTQIASALAHAHEHGVVHRDIKPPNVILSDNLDAAYVVDFGIALSVEDGLKITKSGYVVGTPGYMSPEQERGEPLDSATDIYSLGVTLYEALSGEKVAVGQYRPLSAVNEAIPEEIDRLIQACLVGKKLRISSAKQFALRLAGAFRVQRPLSELLARGTLNEIGLALDGLTPESLSLLPAGQKALILAKVESVVDADDDNLAYPGAGLLETLITRGISLDPADYRRVVSRSLVWAFDKVYPNERMGRRSLQEELAEACLAAGADSHSILREELEAFLKDKKLDDKPDWYLHNLRNVVSCLLANTSFAGDTTSVSGFLQEINEIQRSRPQEDEDAA